MSYLHIENLYRDQSILLFRECYALEKIHGTTARVSWRDGRVHYSPGGDNPIDAFKALFDDEALHSAFTALGHASVTVFGEAYGGSQQGQGWRYGPGHRFTAFEVRIGELWLAVPSADDVTKRLGLEFVHYRKVSTDLAALDAERDAPSEQARRNGVPGDQPREGVVLRPLIELRMNNDKRIIAKHKRDDERETGTPREVVDPSKLLVLTKATEIAEEWVTPTRLQHVLDKLPSGLGVRDTGTVVQAMLDDVIREGAGEFVDGKEARTAIGRKTSELFNLKLKVTYRSRIEGECCGVCGKAGTPGMFDGGLIACSAAIRWVCSTACYHAYPVVSQ